MVIRKVWWEGASSRSGQRRVMAGYGAAALETGTSEVTGGPRGETTRYWCAGIEMGDAQVCR